MKKTNKDFEHRYLQCRQRLNKIDFLERAETIGATIAGGNLTIPFFGKTYVISVNGITDTAGNQPNFAVSLVLCRYVLQCPDQITEDGDWVTYREFRGAGPLLGHFTANTNKTIETAFAGNLTALKESSTSLGGEIVENDPSHDISIKFSFLPKIPLLLHFNDRDETFPAQCSILLKRSAEKYLDLDCLAIGGTYLAGQLISNCEPG